MHLVHFGSFVKPNALSSVVRNASCSHGWLRLLVQSIFAAITVTSFILIVLLTVPYWSPVKPAIDPVSAAPRCRINGCRVVCKEVQFFGDYESEIFLKVTEAEVNCYTVFLTLENPMFPNNTMPPKWLSRLQTSVFELTIYGGNLMHIAPDAFMSQHTRGITVLIFYNLVIKSWATESFVGLSSLRRFYMKDCSLVNVPSDLLRAVDDTLETLTIIKSQHWNPAKITGSTNFKKITTVDFSSNHFNDVLGKNSFTGLQKCKVLYLNSCRISAIGAGAFDNLNSIEMLFLNNNYLVTVPDGLFRNIILLTDPKPRINLQDNLWYCDCSTKDLRQLYSKDILLTEPVCNSPDHFKDKTFTALETYCTKQNASIETNIYLNVTEQTDSLSEIVDDISGFVYVSSGCINGNESSLSSLVKMVSPVSGYECNSKYFGRSGLDSVSFFGDNSDIQVNLKRKWIKFSYYLKTHNYSVVQIGASRIDNYALVWYQSTCPNEVYCMSDIPSFLRIYNVDLNAHYVFCPVLLSSGIIENDNCITYDSISFEFEYAYNVIHILLYVITGIVCLVCGAACVYVLILKNPYLLKGSKRILLVKHKTVDALVLPPKIPLRNDLENGDALNFNEKNFFVVSANHVFPSKFKRNKSTKSSRSNTPSYVSAIQPTEEQLAEWRIRHQFNNDLTITSTRSDVSTISWIYSEDSVHYSFEVDNDRTYESIHSTNIK